MDSPYNFQPHNKWEFTMIAKLNKHQIKWINGVNGSGEDQDFFRTQWNIKEYLSNLHEGLVHVHSPIAIL